MDKNSLSVYGWIAVGLVILGIVLMVVSPFGDFISDLLFSSTSSMMNKAEIARPVSISIEDSLYGQTSLLCDEAFEGQSISLNVKPYTGYIYDGARITTSDDTIILNKNNYSFIAPAQNVTVSVSYSEINESITVSNNNDNASVLVYKNKTAVVEGSGTVSADKVKLLQNTDIDTIIINSGISEIEPNSFSNITSLSTVIIKNSAENIKISSAFPSYFDVNNIIYQ